MPNCPRCRKEISKASKEWNYSRYKVRIFECPKCEKSFKAYYREGKLSHTIPKTKKLG